MDGNIHFSSYEYFKKLEEGSNDKGKRDNKENTEYNPIDLNKYAFFIRFPKKRRTTFECRESERTF